MTATIMTCYYYSHDRKHGLPYSFGISCIICLFWFLVITTITGCSARAGRSTTYYGNSVNVKRKRQQQSHTTNKKSRGVIAVDADDHGDDDTTILPWPQKAWGDDACPCLTRDEWEQIFLLGDNNNNNNTGKSNIDLGSIFISTTATTTTTTTTTTNNTMDDDEYYEYGLGCASHSLHEKNCQSNNEQCNSYIPSPDGCNDDDLSWCSKLWCYVDSKTCNLHSSPSRYFPDYSQQQQQQQLFYSYATCGHIDEFTYDQKIQDLSKLRLRTGFNSNTGGWMGSYNQHGHFAINDEWTGPMVEFVKDAAFQGSFSLVQTAPPKWLVNESTAFWGGSSFNLCVYAVSLGFLDMCVSDLTITPERIKATPFFELDSVPIYLLTFVQPDSISSWEQFVEQVAKIYQPFDREAWLFIFFFCIPSMGLLMLIHEYDSPGTAFTEKKDFRVTKASHHGGSPKIETRDNPMWKQSVKAVYISFLAFFIRSYKVRVYSAGGKLQLLAIMCFILLTTTVYTANLAAQFVQDAQKAPVKNVEEALKQGYNFCSERKAGNIVMNLFGIDSSRLVVDPVSEGGDGLPGFACPDCAARRRVFDFMRQHHNDPDLYCNAAFVLEEDLEVLQHDGSHCNKTIVGTALTKSHRGFALNEKIADAVTPHFYSLKYNGGLAEHYKAAKPVGSCKESRQNTKKQRLSIEAMSGIWVAAYGFALAGLIARALQQFRETYQKEHKVMWVDQWGNAMPNPKAMETLGVEVEDIRASRQSRQSHIERMLEDSMKSLNDGVPSSPRLDPRLDERIARVLEQSIADMDVD